MYKYLVVLISFLFVGCTSLNQDSNFDDAVAKVNQKQNYTQVIAKSLSPARTSVKGADLVDASIELVGNFPIEDRPSPSSFIRIKVTYFKSYSAYNTVQYAGKSVTTGEYAPIASTCSEHCTSTQFLSFDIDNNTLNSSTNEGLRFELINSNKSSAVEFSVPAGYINAVVSKGAHQSSKARAETVSVSKSQEMVEYWYKESVQEERDSFLQWAFDNRNEIQAPQTSGTQSVDMMVYWFEKASIEERKEILSWLMKQ